MKSKQCSHNLQSNQEICLLIIPYITKDLWFWGKKKLKKGNWRSDIISLYYSLVTLKCIDFTCNCISLFRHFLLNSFLCRVWNMQHITNNSHQRVELELCFVANITLNLRWLNTVLQAVSSNSCDSACFKLDKPTRQRKKQWYTEDDFSKSTH